MSRNSIFKYLTLLLSSWTIILFNLCSAAPVDTIYYGGPIITMIKDNHRVEALAVKNGIITASGNKKDILPLKGDKTRLVDLQGHSLMPGFIDPHSHVVMQSAKLSMINLDPYPIGDVKTISDIQRKLRERIKENKIEQGKWLIGWGYDDTGLKENRHPNRSDLDAVSKDHPILLIHISSHLLAVNSKALELAKVSAQTPDPAGGKFQRMGENNEPNGVIEEHAMGAIYKVAPVPTVEGNEQMLEVGLKEYAAAGITTAQEGAAAPGAIKLLREMDNAGKLPIDVVAYPVVGSVDGKMIQEISQDMNKMRRFRLGGVKLILDGSIQGYTAYLSHPYYKKSGESNYRGYPSISQEEVSKWLRLTDSKNIQLLVHCNGDAAIDMLIEGIKTVRSVKPRPDLRTTIVHAQTIREDQLDFVASQGLVPSFFPIHVVFWGDRHRDIFLGPERAARISPSRSALDREIKITLHHDAPVASWGMLPVVSAAVNRITTSGKLLGPKERITPYEAFRAVTKDAAWQYFEEHRKGTLEAGKLADMIILDKDPLLVNHKSINDIKVLETIKEGKTIYRKPNQK